MMMNDLVAFRLRLVNITMFQQIVLSRGKIRLTNHQIAIIVEDSTQKTSFFEHK